jgi:hypothetical protein
MAISLAESLRRMRRVDPALAAELADAMAVLSPDDVQVLHDAAVAIELDIPLDRSAADHIITRLRAIAISHGPRIMLQLSDRLFVEPS